MVETISSKEISFVVPCFNEEATVLGAVQSLISTTDRLKSKRLLMDSFEIVLIDDGSTDETWPRISSIATEYPFVRGIKLSRNTGQQIALLAGLHEAIGEIVITIDADMQDDVLKIDDMIAEYQKGYDVVYGVRQHRPSDKILKKTTARIFYRFMQILDKSTVVNHADFRLMTRKIVDAIKTFDEYNIYLRGIVPQIGFKSTQVFYTRNARTSGTTKYSFFRMISLALDGITSFSTLPLRIISITGLVVWLGSIGMIFWAIWIKLFTEKSIPGWASSVIPTCFLGGLHILCLGVISEYVARIYSETKRRPRYLIAERT